MCSRLPWHWPHWSPTHLLLWSCCPHLFHLIAQCERGNQSRLRDGNLMFNLKINTKCDNKSINICHLTRHLDCPSAPLGEVVHVRLGLVLRDLLEEGFHGDGVSRGRGQTRLKSCSCHNSIMAADLMLINITLCCCCSYWQIQPFHWKGWHISSPNEDTGPSTRHNIIHKMRRSRYRTIDI